MKATLRETDGTRFTVVDEYGSWWAQAAVDGRGNMAVECDTGDRWEARQFTVDSGLSFADGSSGELWPAQQEDSEFIDIDGDRWVATRTDSAGSIHWRKAR